MLSALQKVLSFSDCRRVLKLNPTDLIDLGRISRVVQINEMSPTKKNGLRCVAVYAFLDCPQRGVAARCVVFRYLLLGIGLDRCGHEQRRQRILSRLSELPLNWRGTSDDPHAIQWAYDRINSQRSVRAICQRSFMRSDSSPTGGSTVKPCRRAYFET